jgi:hypothetical protein
MQRENFVFTIGYKDDQAIVDRRTKARYRKLDTIGLYEAGLLKPAAASAIFAKEQGDDQSLRELITRMTGDLGEDFDEARLRRIYGISRNPEDISKVLAV